ncbi:FAD-dependent oxidoreductase [Ethanoligenens sp.]|uniref:FAD-dependent oxidoreductase n=1 Tax=Ethanoligenens sp. TaxID=2099655 RepID=UPI0039E8A561
MENYTQSYWEKTAGCAAFPALEADTEADVLIVGGGITGVSCAYHLAKAGATVLLLESGTLGCGTTGKSTGKVSTLHGALYGRLCKLPGKAEAVQIACTQRDAVAFVKQFALSSDMDCGFAESDAYLFARNEDERQLVENEFEAIKSVGIDARFLFRPDFPPQNICTTVLYGQAVIHPLRYLQALAAAAANKGAKCCEHTKVVQVRAGKTVEAVCENGVRIKSHHLIVATQYPFFENFGAYFTRLYPRRSYGVAVEPERPWPAGSYISAGDPIRSVRTVIDNGKKILLVMGDGHITGRDTREQDGERHFEALTTYAEKLAGPFSLLARWSAQDYQTPDGIPYIGPSAPQSNIYVATGFNKWGLSNGTLAGILLTDWITTGKSARGAPYDPARLHLAGTATMAGELSGQVGAMVQSKLKKPGRAEDLQPGEGGIVLFEGKKAGAYRHPDGRLTVLDITCTHLGCTLTWNEAEKSWDCPCHGGRFTAEGRQLEGPPPVRLRIYYQGGTAPSARTSTPDSRPQG